MRAKAVISQSKITIRAKQTVFRRYAFTLQPVKQLLMRLSPPMLTTATVNMVKNKKFIVGLTTTGTLIAIHLKNFFPYSLVKLSVILAVVFKIIRLPFFKSLAMFFRILSAIVSLFSRKSFQVWFTPLSQLCRTTITAIKTESIFTGSILCKGLIRQNPFTRRAILHTFIIL